MIVSEGKIEVRDELGVETIQKPLAVGSKMIVLGQETHTKHQNGSVWYNTG